MDDQPFPEEFFKRSRMRADADTWRVFGGQAPPLQSQEVGPRVVQDGVEVEFDDPVTGRRWFARVIFQKINGRMEAIELSLADRDGQGITGQSMREVPWGSLINDMRSDFADNYRWLEQISDPSVTSEGTHEAMATGYQSRQGKTITDEQLAKVAEVYRAAVRYSESPTAAVEDMLNLNSRSTAAKWIGRARKAGHLGPASPGKVGEIKEGDEK